MYANLVSLNGAEELDVPIDDINYSAFDRMVEAVASIAHGDAKLEDPAYVEDKWDRA